MANQFGPWATWMNVWGSPQRSAFWQRRMAMPVPTSQTSPMLSWRNVLYLFVASAPIIGLPTYRVVAAADRQPMTQAAAPHDQTKTVDSAEFFQLSEDQQKEALLDAVQANRCKYSNVSLKTTSHVQKVDVDATTKKAGKILEDFGSCAFELRRIDGSYRIALTRYRPGIREPTVRDTNHYNAQSGINRAIATEMLPDKIQEHGLISVKQSQTFSECRYGSFLGGFGMDFLGFPENDFLRFLLEHQKDVQIRGWDQQNGLIEVYFTYQEVHGNGTGSCTMWFDPGKDWLLARRIWERKRPGSQSYERFEVKESQVFDGIWMPTQFAEVTSSSSRGRTMGNLWETTAEDIKIGQVKEEDLELVFPEGTLVRDEIAGERWCVGKGGRKIPYNDNVGGGP